MNRSQVYLKLALTAFFWGAVVHLGKYALSALSPLTVASWRFLGAAALLVPIIFLGDGWSWQALKRNWIALLVMAAVGVFGFNLAFFYGLRQTSAINVALIIAINPALTVLLAALVNREPVSRRQLMGLMLALCGVAVVVTNGTWHALVSLSFSIGDLLVVLATLCWAIYSVIPKRFVSGLTPTQTAGATVTAGAVMLAAFTSERASDFMQMPPLPVVAAVVCMAVFGSALAYLWWNQGLQKIGAASGAVFINLVPIFATVIGFALGQPITASQLLGAILVVSGVLCSTANFNWLARRAAMREPVAAH